MTRNSDGQNDSDHLDTGSPLVFDDDGDVSNIAVGAASPTCEAQSPVEVPAGYPQFHGDASVSGSQLAADSPNTNPAGSQSALDNSPALLPSVNTTACDAPSRNGVGGLTTSNAAALSSAYAPTRCVPPQTQGGQNPPHTLVLNKHNLATFEDSVQRGVVPLRTDVIHDHNYFGPAGNHQRRAANNQAVVGNSSNPIIHGSTSMITNCPSRTVRESSTGMLNENDSTLTFATPLAMMSQSGEPGVDAASFNSPLNREEPSRFTRAERYSVVSAVSTAGSTLHRPADPLSQENLQLHLKELTSGEPVPLTTENIGAGLPKAARKPPRRDNDGAGEDSNPNSNGGDGILSNGDRNLNRRDASLVVEASEAAPSDVASTVPSSVIRATLRNAVHSDVAMELWSTASTHEEGKSQASWGPSTDALQSLSKKSLRQLRRQLESGETPLRPEVLAGLGTVVKAMSACSELSPSMVVEVPGDEAGHHSASHDYGTGLHGVGGDGGPSNRGRGQRGPHRGDDLDDDVDDDVDGDLDDGGSGSMQFKTPANVGVEVAASDAGGMSFHSTFVEVPDRGHPHAMMGAGRSDSAGLGANGGGGSGGSGSGSRGGAEAASRSKDMFAAVEGPDSLGGNCSAARQAAPGSGSGAGAGGGASASGGAGGGGANSSGRGRTSEHGDSGVPVVPMARATGCPPAAGASAAAHHLNISADLSANNGDLFDDDDVVDEEEEEEEVDRNTHDDVDEVGDKSTTALSPDDDDGHNEESVFMTEDGMEPHDDIAYLKRCLAEVMRTLKDTRKDQVQLSRQLQSIKDDLSRSRAGGRGLAFPNVSWEQHRRNRSPPKESTSDAAVDSHIASLRADMDEVRLYMREMQRSQMELIRKIESFQGGGNHDGASNSGSSNSSPLPHPKQQKRNPSTGSLPADSSKVHIVVQCDASLLQSSDKGGKPLTTAEPVPFLMPMPLHATVRQCKEEFLRRLGEQRSSAAAGLTVENTCIEMNGHALFDSLALGADLQLGRSEGAKYHFLLKKTR